MVDSAQAWESQVHSCAESQALEQPPEALLTPPSPPANESVLDAGLPVGATFCQAQVSCRRTRASLLAKRRTCLTAGGGTANNYAEIADLRLQPAVPLLISCTWN